MASLIKLRKNITPEHLNKTYADNYYAYLHSDEFKETFLQPIADFVGTQSCFDVGCGEGALAELTQGMYIGIDGSKVAIERAIEKFKGNNTRYFEVGRVENPPEVGRVDVVVFSAILDFIVEKESHVPLLEYYLRYRPKYFVISDLIRMDCSNIAKRFEQISSVVRTVDYDDVEPIKRTRRMDVFKV